MEAHFTFIQDDINILKEPGRLWTQDDVVKVARNGLADEFPDEFPEAASLIGAWNTRKVRTTKRQKGLYRLGQPAGGPDRNRTCDTRFRKPLLYPLSYGADIIVPSSLPRFNARFPEGLSQGNRGENRSTSR